MKQKELTIEEIDYLLKRVTFTYKNCTVSKARELCGSIIAKLEKMKEENNARN